MGDVRWTVNQRKAFLDQDNAPLVVTILPAVCQSLLHTGSETIHVSDQVYVRFLTNCDVETQRSAERIFRWRMVERSPTVSAHVCYIWCQTWFDLPTSERISLHGWIQEISNDRPNGSRRFHRRTRRNHSSDRII